VKTESSNEKLIYDTRNNSSGEYILSIYNIWCSVYMRRASVRKVVNRTKYHEDFLVALDEVLNEQ